MIAFILMDLLRNIYLPLFQNFLGDKFLQTDDIELVLSSKIEFHETLWYFYLIL
jgi:hypothetical protein